MKKNEDIIKSLEHNIKILEDDLKTYGKTNKKVADYDIYMINKYKSRIINLEGLNNG